MIREIKSDSSISDFKKHLGDCLILDGNNRLYLQKNAAISKIHLFGGHIEEGETPEEGMKREIFEETGARIRDDCIMLGSIIEAENENLELIHVWFWHDKNNEITGCYEREPIWFNNAEEIIRHPDVMEYAKWAVERARELRLLPY